VGQVLLLAVVHPHLQAVVHLLPPAAAVEVRVVVVQAAAGKFRLLW